MTLYSTVIGSLHVADPVGRGDRDIPAFLPIGVGVAVLRFETAHDAMPEPASAHAKKPKFAV